MIKAVHFGCDDCFREPEFGDAIDEHAAWLVQGFENGDIMAQSDKFASGGQARGSGADDGGLSPRGRRGVRGHLIQVLVGPVRDKAFEVTDLIKSIAQAKIVNPDRNTNPAQTLDEYYEFVTWAETCMPWSILPNTPYTSLYDKIDQSLDYFYFINDIPLPELEGKGLYNNSLQYVKPYNDWLVSFIKAWGLYLDTPASWKDEYYQMALTDSKFGLSAGWYEDQSSSRTNYIIATGLGVVIILFLGAAIRYLFINPPANAADWTRPFYDPKTFTLSSVSAGASLAVLTYIGFDGISTLSEEVHNPRRNILLATVLVCIITGILASVQVYFAQMITLTHQFR